VRRCVQAAGAAETATGQGKRLFETCLPGVVLEYCSLRLGTQENTQRLRYENTVIYRLEVGQG